jgi:pSer/pThr/pTyr-binding forkhead associated (FHA) protein
VFAQLVPADGGEPITIDKDVMVVGRQSEHCDIVLTRKSVSKIHCIIAKTDGLLFVRDLDSTNGTKVNGQRIMRGALLPGDLLAFAGEKFQVRMGPKRKTSHPDINTIEGTQNLSSGIDPDQSDQIGDAPLLGNNTPRSHVAEDLVE